MLVKKMISLSSVIFISLAFIFLLMVYFVRRNIKVTSIMLSLDWFCKKLRISVINLLFNYCWSQKACIYMQYTRYMNVQKYNACSSIQHSNGHSLTANIAIGLLLGIITTVAVLNIINDKMTSDGEEAPSLELEVSLIYKYFNVFLFYIYRRVSQKDYFV